MTAAAQNIKDAKSLTELIKIPEKEFEKEFRDWMERDGVARALQSKLRSDLISNFNKTSLGKRLMAESTNRLTLSSMVLALNTLVAEFLYAQDCHFSLSVFCTEVPFRNALPDFEQERHFRFKEAEIFDIMKAICNTTTIDWNTKNKLAKKYATSTSTSLLSHIIQILLEKNAESMQKKINVGTNTRSGVILLENQNKTEKQKTQCDENNEFYNTNFRHLNKYLIILSRKVNEMTKHFEQLQTLEYLESGNQPQVRYLKSSRNRKYEDLNRSLERVTANLKQILNAKKKNKYFNTFVQAIERLAIQFQRCVAKFDSVTTPLGSVKQMTETRGTQVESSSSTTPTTESLQQKQRSRKFAASQTDAAEKSYSDWLHEMRYTRNGQKFLDRVERSLQKAMDNQKKALLLENEVRLRHQCELLKIRYKQKLLEHMCINSGIEHGESTNEKQELKESISEQFRQFELKHFNLLSKIYESEIEIKPVESTETKPETSTTRIIPSHLKVDESRSLIEMDSSEPKGVPPAELYEQQQKNPVLPQSSLDIRQHIRDAVEEVAEEERNVNKIVDDAKMRIKELEEESNQITDNFLEYLERQRKQRLDARDAAQNLWNDYLNENENMNAMYADSNCSEGENTKILENLKKQILNNNPPDEEKGATKRQNKCNRNIGSNSSSSDSTSYYRLENPISKAKEDFFERERMFKQESERILSQQDATILESDTINTTAGNRPDMPFELFIHKPIQHTFPVAETKNLKASFSNSIMIAQFLNDSYNDSGSDFNMLCKNTSGNKKSTTTTATATKTIIDGNSSSSQDIQNGGGDRNHKIETPKTLPVLTASKEQTANITIPATTAMSTTSSAFLTANTTAKTFNKSNNHVEGYNNSFEVSFVEAPQETSFPNGCNTMGEFGKKNAQQNERNNDNHKSYCYNDNNNNNKNNNDKRNKNNGSNKKRISSAKPIEGSSKTSVGDKITARKSLLQQSMARMQQLFSPHHQQNQQHQHDKKQNRQKHQLKQLQADDNVVEDVLAERNEANSQVTLQKSNKTSILEEKRRSSNNQNAKVYAAGSGSENVFSDHKDNFKLHGTSEQKQQQQTPRSIDDDVDGAFTHAKNIRTQQNDATNTSSNNDNKAIEVRHDWQQISCSSASGGKSAFKVNEATAKGTSKVVDASIVKEKTPVVNEEMNVDGNAVERGEIIEDDRIVVAVGTSIHDVLRAQQKREIGKWIESGDAAAPGVSDSAANNNNFVSLSIQSSLSSSEELQFSHVGGGRVGGGVGAGGDAGSLLRKGVGSNNALLEIGSGSDSNSDFWA